MAELDALSPASATVPTEQPIWEGSPGQWVNFGNFFAAALLTLITVGFGVILFGPWAAICYFRTKKESYRLTTQRLFTSSGLFSVTEDELELYRVRDSRLDQPFVLRLVGLANIVLSTTDDTNSVVVIRAAPVAQAKQLRESIRAHVEARRDQKGMREIDMRMIR